MAVNHRVSLYAEEKHGYLEIFQRDYINTN
jgi:hypothetical protein